MVGLFFSSNNNTSTGMDSNHSPDTLSPGAIVGLVIGLTVILGGAIYCGWRQYRCWCRESAPVAPTGQLYLQEVKDDEGRVIAIRRVYGDGSILALPVEEEPVLAISTVPN